MNAILTVCFFLIVTLMMPLQASAELNNCSQPSLKISKIQGSGSISAFNGKRVRVNAIVSAAFQNPENIKSQKNKVNGFFLIEELKDQDQDALTSEGIFVYSNIPVSVGQQVSFKAQVKEYFGLTELVSVQNLEVCADKQPVPRPKQLLPEEFQQNTIEAIEGMPVTITQSWVVGNNKLRRFGELEISGQNSFGSTGSKTSKYLTENLIIDDGVKGRNTNHFASTNALRLGAELKSFDAVVTYTYGNYHLLPLQRIHSSNTNRPERLNTPPNATFSLAQFNVKNLFNGDGAKKGFPTSRGRKTFPEYQLQLAKLALAIRQLNTDAIALIEIENDGFGEQSAIADLTRAVNSELVDNQKYQFAVTNPKDTGTDKITQAFLYRPSKLQINQARFLHIQSGNTPARPVLVVNVTTTSHNSAIQISIVHFKSRSGKCPDDLPEPDRTEPLEGNCHNQRLKLSQSLLTKLPIFDGVNILAGDFNAYPGEQALTLLTNNGWIDTRQRLNKMDSYSYVYQDNPIILDHFFVGAESAHLLLDQTDWHINAAESDLVFEEEFKAGDFSVYRSSDHDPGILYFKE